MHGLKLRRLSENMSGSSNLGTDGRNSPTGADFGGGGDNGIMLFGVRLTAEGSTSTNFRKSFSMNNLWQYDQPTTAAQDSNADTGYASADDVVHHASDSGRSRERKRGVPWTEEEHKMFLLRLQKVGKGDWRGISRNFVKTRTPTQVASHAQKYFLRRNNQNRRRRRSSLFDITTASFVNSTIEEEPEEYVTLQPTLFTREFPMSTLSLTLSPASISAAGERSVEKIAFGPTYQGRETPDLIRPPVFPVPPSAKMTDLYLNRKYPDEEDLPLTLNLNLSSMPPKKPPPSSSTRSSAFQSITGGDSIISVA